SFWNLKGATSKSKKILQFSIAVPAVPQGYQICVSGESKALGNWDVEKPLLLGCDAGDVVWSGSANLDHFTFPSEYKYGYYDTRMKKLVAFESGHNRSLEDHSEWRDIAGYLVSDVGFKYPQGPWRGAGVAVPVFSLRSDESFGIGEFNDLPDLIDWAKTVGLSMVQILPVNETIATHSWLDSYPYKSISVFALHPVFLNLQKMGKLKDKKAIAQFSELQQALNAEEFVNYPEVHKIKSAYFKLLFDQEKDSFFEDPSYVAFFESNKDWLVPYAAYAFLRDKNKTADFRKWGKYSEYNRKSIEKLCQPGTKDWDDISIHYFLQYHLDKQLKEVSSYARKQGIVLKGDIPIGISPNSVEAWTEPELFNLRAQAGAPPDAFAIKGQNWGFPTYNWEKMAEDGYIWWKKRLSKMAEYFDAYRIDHILGFFRIWEIPEHAVEGLLGTFNPALPLTADEIKSFGLDFDYERLVKPYIRHHLLGHLFGVFTDEVIDNFLEETAYRTFKMKAGFDTQKKVNDHFLKDTDEENLDEKNRRIRDGLFELIANVLFIESGYNQFQPRITFQHTSSFADMDIDTQNRLNELYNHFFYKRHDDFWYHKAMDKLPGIISATDMLVCGEDLGMVPDCVHPVMDQLGILSLEIQRMSKDPKRKFAHPADAPYMSVCTTSTHDMSTTRGWWESDRNLIQQFYNEQLGNPGEAPFFAEPWLCEQIVRQHAHSPAMWTTFPIQDLMAMDGAFRWEKTHEEKINEPSNVRHHWKYRMFQKISDLKHSGRLNDLIRQIILESGRFPG
ncbi:MAG TPA: 4-alpha-glucanotransferase, partial [Saprospirales bacterium]|nr:4-alpha-glucanotransferase [Saprospirales bacterium]